MNPAQAIAILRELQQFLDNDTNMAVEYGIAALEANANIQHIFENASTTEELFYKLRDLFGYSGWEIANGEEDNQSGSSSDSEAGS